jgi:hypothetical protein
MPFECHLIFFMEMPPNNRLKRIPKQMGSAHSDGFYARKKEDPRCHSCVA